MPCSQPNSSFKSYSFWILTGYCFIAFTFPFRNIQISNIALLLIMVCSIYLNFKERNWRTNYFEFVSIWAPFVLLYLIEVTSLFQCEDKHCLKVSLNYLERHALFGAYPFLFLIARPITAEALRKVIVCLTGSILLHGVILFFSPDYTVDKPYLGIFISFSFAYWFDDFLSQRKKSSLIISLTLAIVCVVLLAKTALVLIFLLSIFLLYTNLKSKPILITITLSGITGLVALALINQDFIKSIFLIKSFSWKVCLQTYLSSGSYIFGVGVGNAEKLLTKTYHLYPDWMAYMEYNSHNQYLEFILSHGFVGLLIFLSWLFFLLRHIKYTSTNYLTCFTIIISISFLSESVLWRQKGILFVLIFVMLLVQQKVKFNPKVN